MFITGTIVITHYVCVMNLEKTYYHHNHNRIIIKCCRTYKYVYLKLGTQEWLNN